MKLNENDAIRSAIDPHVLLVPYCAHHVSTYHEWMKDPELRALTASEPLSLAEEYDMQRSWRTDGDKLTFIVCVVEHEGVEGGREVWGGEDDLSQVMVGDVNLFLFEEDAAGEAGTTSGSGMRDVVGEVEIMIAQSSARGRGVGRRALSMFLRYVWGNRQSIVGEFGTSQRGADGDGPRMQLSYLRAKIDAGNDRSIALFRKVGFEMVSEEPNYFGEVEMRWNMDETKSDRIQQEIGGDGDCVVQYRIRDEETNDTN